MSGPLDYNATLAERIDYDEVLGTFRIRPDRPFGEAPGTPDSSARRFLPGQYTTLGLDNTARPELGSMKRAMSIASPPEGDEPLEFFIRRVDPAESPNPFTHLLWNLRPGDRIWMADRAKGHFTIEDTIGSEDPRLRICVAAGTGLAPFLAMVRSEALRGGDLSRFVLLHGASYPTGLGPREELEALASERGLRYRGTVSRPQEARDWSGDTGRVEDYFLPERLPELEDWLGLPRGGLRPDLAVVYVCGLRGTIANTLTRVVAQGFVPRDAKIRRALEVSDEVPAQLFYEQYDVRPVIDVDDPAVIEPLRDRLHDRPSST